jgi:hypothetical protein
MRGCISTSVCSQRSLPHCSPAHCLPLGFWHAGAHPSRAAPAGVRCARHAAAPARRLRRRRRRSALPAPPAPALPPRCSAAACAWPAARPAAARAACRRGGRPARRPPAAARAPAGRARAHAETPPPPPGAAPAQGRCCRMPRPARLARRVAPSTAAGAGLLRARGWHRPLLPAPRHRGSRGPAGQRRRSEGRRALTETLAG